MARTELVVWAGDPKRPTGIRLHTALVINTIAGASDWVNETVDRFVVGAFREYD